MKSEIIIFSALALHCLADNTNKLTFSEILSLKNLVVIDGRIENGNFSSNAVWSIKRTTNTIQWLQSGKPGRARFVRWAETNYYIISSINPMPLALIATPNFSIPESVVPYQVKLENKLYIIGDVFPEYTNDVVHVMPIREYESKKAPVVPK